MTTSLPSPALSRIVAVDEIPPGGLPLDVRTTEGERGALAAANALRAIRLLSAALKLTHEAKGGVHVSGHVSAEITQTCVVSLEAFDTVIREPVDVHFLPAAALDDLRAARRQQPADPDADNEPDEPDAILNGRIDVGALVAEYLTLSLDPYPRKPGATLDARATAAEPRVSPFAVLRERTGEDT